MLHARTAATTAEAEERRRIINRLRRLEGQIRGLQSMISGGQECQAVLTQIMAAKSALNQVGMHIVGHAMKRCLLDEATQDRDEVVEAAFQVFLRYRTLASEAAPVDLDVPASDPDAVIERLKGIELELQHIQLILEEPDTDCELIVARVSRATASINAVALAVLGHSMRECLIPGTVKGRDALIDEAVAVFLRYSSCVK